MPSPEQPPKNAAEKKPGGRPEKKQPKALKQEMDTLRDGKRAISDTLSEKVAEAQSLIRESIMDLIGLLVSQAPPSLNVRLRKLGKSKKWVFEISFSESDLTSRPDVTRAISDVGEYASAAEIKSPIEEENA